MFIIQWSSGSFSFEARDRLMLIYPFVVRNGLCSCNGMLKSEPEAVIFLYK